MDKDVWGIISRSSCLHITALSNYNIISLSHYFVPLPPLLKKS